MAIRFLSTIEQWKDFSNLAPYAITIDGEEWFSTEHYYQYQKYKDIDPSFATYIKWIPNPKDVKKLCIENDTKHGTRDAIKVDILSKAVQVKFTSYSNLRRLLLSTGSEELIEANPDDYFRWEWTDGSGKNMMGKILMDIRNKLQ